MKQIDLPEFDEISAILNKTKAKLHPSQAHGLICGILCASPTETVAWKEWVLGDHQIDKANQAIEDLYQYSAKQLREFLFELDLLLPSEEEGLRDRAEALTLWSQGFLTGLKLMQIPIVDREPSEMTEAINDIIEIAKMNYEEVVASEEDEAAYIELVEYVRMAVIFIYQDLHSEPKAPEDQDEASRRLH